MRTSTGASSREILIEIRRGLPACARALLLHACTIRFRTADFFTLLLPLFCAQRPESDNARYEDEGGAEPFEPFLDSTHSFPSAPP